MSDWPLPSPSPAALPLALAFLPPSPPLGRRGMSLSKELALSSQPCRQRMGEPFGEPQALAAMWPQGTATFSSENRPESHRLSPGASVLEPLVRALPLTPTVQSISDTQDSCAASGVTGRDPEVGLGVPRGGEGKLSPLSEENLGRASPQNFPE